MNDTLKQSLHGVAVYNPDLLSKTELISYFVARRPLLDRLLGDLRREATPQHRLIIGQRGMGKTTLLRRLRYGIEDDPELSRRWLPLTFPEEQYDVVRLSDLYLNCIDALGDTLEEMGRHAEAEALDGAVEALPDRAEPERARQALEILLGAARRLDRGLVLLIDNIELVFERLKEHQWTLRELLSVEQRLLLVGASASMLEATYVYKEPFYDFFLVHELKGLNEGEMRDVLRNLAQLGKTPAVERVLDEDPARIRTLHVLSGGNPRTLVLLYGVLAQGTEGDVRSDLERLLDQCTPLYKARFEALPAQMQQIVDAMAIHWDPISAGELAAQVRLEAKAVSSQLNRLADQGLIEKVEYHPAGKLGYQVAERFFNIWYLMRASRRVRRRLVWLVEFLKLFYGREHLAPHARRHLRAETGADANSRVRHAEYSLALAEAVEERPLRRALESTAMRVLTVDRELREKLSQIIDLEGIDAELKPLVDKHRAAAELQEVVAAAEVRWEGWDPKRFGELLGGVVLLSPAQKLQIARSLANWDQFQIEQFEKICSEEMKGWGKVISAFDREKLRHALLSGFMSELEDVDGAETAAVVLDAPGLPAIALSRLLESRVDIQRIESLRTALGGCFSCGPWYTYGNLLQDHLGRFEEAEKAYRRAIELGPAFAYPWNGLGNLLKNHLGRFEEAEGAYRKAIELDPGAAYPWNNLGNLLKDYLGQLEEAEEAYRKAIELDPALAFSWNNLGNLLKGYPGRLEEAEEAYRRAIELDPTFAFYWDNLGNLLQHHLARLEEAEEAYRKAIELEPTYAYFWSSLAWLRYTRGKVDEETESAACKAVELDPTDLDSAHTLATILAYRDNWPEAEPLARRFLIEGSPEFHQTTWPDLLLFFREAARTGHAPDAVRMLDDLGFGERWRPLREALAAISAGTRAYLRRIAPEVRQPAEQLLLDLGAESLPDRP
jgi:tetratricopeptide (TPR) repeat protein